MTDWVAIGSFLAVGISAIIVILLVIKGYNLIYKDKD